jgi:hypothetical protein
MQTACWERCHMEGRTQKEIEEELLEDRKR